MSTFYEKLGKVIIVLTIFSTILNILCNTITIGVCVYLFFLPNIERLLNIHTATNRPVASQDEISSLKSKLEAEIRINHNLALSNALLVNDNSHAIQERDVAVREAGLNTELQKNLENQIADLITVMHETSKETSNQLSAVLVTLNKAAVGPRDFLTGRPEIPRNDLQTTINVLRGLQVRPELPSDPGIHESNGIRRLYK